MGDYNPYAGAAPASAPTDWRSFGTWMDLLLTTSNTSTTLITANVTKTIGPIGADFLEPGDFTEWLNARRIKPGVTVTVSITAGTYNCTKPIRGHVDGRRVVWTNAGLNGSALVGADFVSLDSIWVIDQVTGITGGSMATAKAAAEVIVRAKYKVILEFATINTAFCVDGYHSGDWTACPTLFINTGTCVSGLSTGSATSHYGDGAGGTAVVEGSCFFGFTNCNLFTDYGGVINFWKGISAFPGQICLRADFAGGFYADHCIILGGAQYGYRSNHGGYIYGDSAYIRGCNEGAECTNTPGMFWLHNSDVQYCYIGVQVSWGGSGKCVNSKIKNNARIQASIPNNGTLDLRSCDMATTATFTGGLGPTYGLYASLAGAVDFSTIVSGGFQTATCTGHQKDISIDGNPIVNLLNNTHGSCWQRGIQIYPDASTSYLLPPAAGVGTYATVEMSGTTLTLPQPCPATIGVVQPSGSAGAPITIATVDFTTLAIGASVAIVAANALTGEVITINDSSTVALAAPVRYLGSVRDILLLFRPQSSVLICEQSYKRNNNNGAGDQKRVRVYTSTGAVSVTIEDDVLVLNKVTGAATAISLDAALNIAGREVVVKDGKGDALTNHITITPGGGATIDGAATSIITQNYGEVFLRHNGTEWNAAFPTSAVLSDSTWAARPSASANSGKRIFITDIGIPGGSLWISDGTDWKPLYPVTVARSTAQVVLTGTVTETNIVSIALPAGILGLNGGLEIEVMVTCTGSTNSKTLFGRLSTAVNLLGTAFISAANVTAANISLRIPRTVIRNRASASAQIGAHSSLLGGGGFSTGPLLTGAINTANAFYFNLNGTVVGAAEVLNIEYYEVRIIP